MGTRLVIYIAQLHPLITVMPQPLLLRSHKPVHMITEASGAIEVRAKNNRTFQEQHYTSSLTFMYTLKMEMFYSFAQEKHVINDTVCSEFHRMFMDKYVR